MNKYAYREACNYFSLVKKAEDKSDKAYIKRFQEQYNDFVESVYPDDAGSGEMIFEGDTISSDGDFANMQGSRKMQGGSSYKTRLVNDENLEDQDSALRLHSDDTWSTNPKLFPILRGLKKIKVDGFWGFETANAINNVKKIFAIKNNPNDKMFEDFDDDIFDMFIVNRFKPGSTAKTKMNIKTTEDGLELAGR